MRKPSEAPAAASTAPEPMLQDRRGSVFHRTKTGCSTCRERKVKCDEKRPFCTQCLRRKHHCPFGYSV
ncbi:hypothetical protein BDY21DRAFT_53124 [Lineolata rhizophorae]|uniref:Zn(2)-C6 fungal-type domain-containing protein n=1 Tax=Lineolata rhizophorae TaxID=578093 RepID=A0A6A6NZ39_9PEZI|nr:hypothetical protein BDY21DRAFT_53124 [Lineolata rhizophorae]